MMALTTPYRPTRRALPAPQEPLRVQMSQRWAHLTSQGDPCTALRPSRRFTALPQLGREVLAAVQGAVARTIQIAG